MWNQYSCQAVTSSIGTRLSRFEQTMGMDRYDLKSDGKLVSAATLKTVESFKSTTLSNILSSDKFIKFDMLARNVIEEGIPITTKVQVGSIGKLQEIKVGEQRFRQVGTSYYGDVA
jgi:hypothetical protein